MSSSQTLQALPQQYHSRVSLHLPMHSTMPGLPTGPHPRTASTCLWPRGMSNAQDWGCSNAPTVALLPAPGIGWEPSASVGSWCNQSHSFCVPPTQLYKMNHSQVIIFWHDSGPLLRALQSSLRNTALKKDTSHQVQKCTKSLNPYSAVYFPELGELLIQNHNFPILSLWLCKTKLGGSVIFLAAVFVKNERWIC